MQDNFYFFHCTDCVLLYTPARSCIYVRGVFIYLLALQDNYEMCENKSESWQTELRLCGFPDSQGLEVCTNEKTLQQKPETIEKSCVM